LIYPLFMCIIYSNLGENLLLSEFDFELLAELIAQRPLAARDASRMLVLDKASGNLDDRRFAEFPDLLRGDELVVLNNARVIPARLFCHRAGVRAERAGKESMKSGEFLSTRIEVLLSRRLDEGTWEALVRPGRKVRVGERLIFEGGELGAEVIARGEFGLRTLRFTGSGDVLVAIQRIGHVPLPPYIRRGDEGADSDRYQTIFASHPGAVAAPTAGLHFTPEILQRIKARGVATAEITLDVGLGTFQPIREDNLDAHRMHSESYEIPGAATAAIAEAHREGRPILAIGTTVVRALEDAASKAANGGLPPGSVPAGRGVANIFIRPGYRFALVNQLLTNFHLPRSTLLVLVAALAGKEPILHAYRHAMESGYRFYSYGDCMLIR
jgi:S-adenosylmethionine:tRNA ribosyltransferase-isomerase